MNRGVVLAADVFDEQAVQKHMAQAARERGVRQFIADSLKPAKIMTINLDEETMTAQVIVPEDNLALAIGQKGQNVQLASRLSGWKIDIRGDEAMRKAETTAEIQPWVKWALLGLRSSSKTCRRRRKPPSSTPSNTIPSRRSPRRIRSRLKA